MQTSEAQARPGDVPSTGGMYVHTSMHIQSDALLHVSARGFFAALGRLWWRGEMTKSLFFRIQRWGRWSVHYIDIANCSIADFKRINSQIALVGVDREKRVLKVVKECHFGKPCIFTLLRLKRCCSPSLSPTSPLLITDKPPPSHQWVFQE